MDTSGETSDRDIIEALGLGGVLEALPDEPDALNPFRVGDRVLFSPHALFGVRATGTVRAVEDSWVLVLSDEPWPHLGPGEYRTEPTRLHRGRLDAGPLDAGPHGDIRWVRPLNRKAKTKRR